MSIHSMLTAASLGPSVLHVSELRIPTGLVPATSLPVSSSINIGLEAICLDFRHTMFRPCQTHCPMPCHHDAPSLHMPYYSVTACKSHINHTAQDAPLLIEPIPGMSWSKIPPSYRALLVSKGSEWLRCPAGLPSRYDWSTLMSILPASPPRRH